MYTGKWMHNRHINVSWGCSAVDESLHDTDFVKLNGMQWILVDEDDLMPFVELIEKAEPETLVTARPQLYQVLAMIKQAMWDRYIEHTSSIRGGGLLEDIKTPTDIIARVIKRSYEEGLVHLKNVAKTPGDISSLDGAAAALKVAAEAMEFSKALPLKQAGAWFKEAEKNFIDLANKTVLIIDGVGNLHSAVVNEHLPDPDLVLDEARESIKTALSQDAGTLTPRTFSQGLHLTGEWEPGDRMNLLRRLPDYKDTELKGDSIEKLRTIVCEAMSEYDQIFHRPGFVNLLRQASAMARYEAMTVVDRETVASPELRATCEHDEAKRRAKDPSNWRTRDTDIKNAKQTVRERVERINSRQANYLETSKKLASISEGLDSLMTKVALELGLEPALRIVKMERQDGLDILRFSKSKPGDNVIVIYPDQREHSYADAVYTAIIPEEKFAAYKSLPTLEEVRDEDSGIKGTNFRNMEDLLVSMREIPMQKFAFGSPVVLDGAIPGTTSSKLSRCSG